MADLKISDDYSSNPFTWNGTEVLPGIKSGANGAGLVSALATFITTGFAPLASPTFTGAPLAPTATTADSTTKLATTAFVHAALTAGGFGTGDVVGPASATTLHLVVFNGTTGKLVQDGGAAPTGTNTGDQTSVTGNAGTATALQTARTIGGVSFDGTANITQPFDVQPFYPGIPTASAKVCRIPLARAVTFAANFAGSYFSASANAAATTVFDVQKNGSSIGSISIASGGTTATFTTTSGTSKTFAAGDVLAIIAPATPDTTLADPGFALAGAR